MNITREFNVPYLRTRCLVVLFVTALLISGQTLIDQRHTRGECTQLRGMCDMREQLLMLYKRAIHTVIAVERTSSINYYVNVILVYTIRGLGVQ